jgi:peptidoglycan/LPS O-acetylase OafA/YrhL
VKILSRQFDRVTSSVTLIPQIDGLRGLAIFFVIANHVFAIFLETTHRFGTQSLPRDWAMIYNRSALIAWLQHLRFGVSIFFAISGFILAIPFCRDIQSGKPFPSIHLFLLRRIIRIEPPYVLSMTFFFLWIVAPWGNHFHARIMLQVFGGHYLATLVYLHALIYREPSWINGVAWTLEVEMQLYLLMPAFAYIYKIPRATLRRGIMIALIFLSAIFDQVALPHISDPRISLSIIGNLEFLWAGLLLADLYLNPPSLLKLNSRIYDALFFTTATATIAIFHWLPALSCFLPFILIVFFLSTFHGKWASQLFTLRVLTVPGTIGYTIYLYHFFIVRALMPYTLRLVPPVHALWLDTAVQIVIMLFPVLAISAVLYLLAERPFIVLSHEMTRRWRARNTANPVGA